jgi:hypothetical protein
MVMFIFIVNALNTGELGSTCIPIMLNAFDLSAVNNS